MTWDRIWQKIIIAALATVLLARVMGRHIFDDIPFPVFMAGAASTLVITLLARAHKTGQKTSWRRVSIITVSGIAIILLGSVTMVFGYPLNIILLIAPLAGAGLMFWGIKYGLVEKRIFDGRRDEIVTGRKAETHGIILIAAGALILIGALSTILWLYTWQIHM